MIQSSRTVSTYNICTVKHFQLRRFGSKYCVHENFIDRSNILIKLNTKLVYKNLKT